MPQLYDQPDSTPTRKVTAGALGGATTIILVWLARLLGVEVPPEVASAFTLLIGFVASYITQESK